MENEEIITVENKGGKGNPNHAPAGTSKGGQFVSGPESGGNIEKPVINDEGEDDVGTFKLHKIPDTPLGNALMSFVSQKKEIINAQAKQYIDSVRENLTEEKIQFYNSLSKSEKLELLYDSPLGYDKKRLGFATDAQIDALLYAECIKNAPIQLEQEKILLEKEKNEINNVISEKLKQNDIESFPGIWKNSSPTPSQYQELKDSGSFDKKKEYYEGVLANSESPLIEKVKSKQFLSKLNEFEKLGTEYEQLKAEISAEYVDKLEEIESKLTQINEKKAYFDDKLIGKADEYINKFVDKDAVYSQARKNAAVWFQSLESAYGHFKPISSQHWKNMSEEQRSVIEAYTGSGYSRFNKPLREIAHDPDGYSFGDYGLETFSKGVNNMTEAIDKCTWDEDIWVNRFIRDDTKMFVLPGTSKKKSLESMTDAEFNSLVGTAFTDNGFVSSGAAKKTGYHTGHIIFNIYCPKGTKMMYAAPYSAVGAGENEMIIQRGYSYRITKVERKGGYHYLDMEVVLGSDANKPVGNDLKKLGNEYYYKPRGKAGEAYA